MADLANDPSPHLFALTLARALDLELSDTTEICLGGNVSTSELTSEVRLCTFSASERRSHACFNEKQLTEIESLLNGVLRQVHILKSDLRPINRLPPELLVYIFAFLGGGSLVVPASHVCQKWREIALGAPSLWTVIREEDDECAALCFMHRSRSLPLDISYPIFMPEPDGFAAFRELVAPHAARIRRLHAHVHGDRVFDFYALLAARDFSLPALEHFSVRMSEYGFRDDTCDDVLPAECFFPESESLARLTFRAALPLHTQLSSAIRSLTLAERAFDLDALLTCLAVAPNLEYLALLNSVPYTFECKPREPVSLLQLKELHWFQVWVFDDLLGTVKFFEHLIAPNLDDTRFVLLLDPTKYSAADLYPPSCQRALHPFGPITELHLEACHFTPGKPARNNLVFHGRRAHETLFTVRLHRGSLDAFCAAAAATSDGSIGIALTSSLRVDVAHLTQLTFSSAHPYDWSRFFRHPDAWPRFLRTLPSVKVLRLRVTQPIQIIAAISAAEEHADPSNLLPNLRVLHLFRPTIPPLPPSPSPTAKTMSSAKAAKAAKAVAAAAGAVGSMCDGDAGKILLDFLRRRADQGTPIESIVCSPEDAEGLPPEVFELVDSVELDHPGTWGTEPLFPKSMIPLLEEHLD